MPVFAYEGRDKQGNRITGTVEAAEERAAVKQLHENGYFVTGVRRDDRPPAGRTALPTTAAARPPAAGAPLLGVNDRDLSIYFRELHQMLHAGITLVKAFDLLSENSSSAALRRVAKSIGPALAEGGKLSTELHRYPTVFSPLVVGMITAGEEGGFLDRACQQISQFLERDYELRQQIKRETLYPKLVIFVALITGAIIPAASSITTGGFGMAFLRSLLSQLAGLAVPATVIGGIWLALKLRLGGNVVQKIIADGKLLIPWVGTVVKKIALARFCRALAALYAAGMGIGRSLELAADACGNDAIAGFVRSRIPEVEQGGRLSQLMRGTSYFPPMVVNMLTVGEETGNIDGSLTKVAEYYELESETALRAMTKVLGVGAFLGVAGMVTIRLVGFYTGYFNDIMKLAE